MGDASQSRRDSNEARSSSPSRPSGSRLRQVPQPEQFARSADERSGPIASNHVSSSSDAVPSSTSFLCNHVRTHWPQPRRRIEERTLVKRKIDVFRIANLPVRARANLLDWLMEVSHVLKLRRGTYYLAIDYIDRCLSKIRIHNERHLKLIGVTCLYIAIKQEEKPNTKPAGMAFLTNGACTKIDIMIQEIDILTILRADLQPVTVIGWLCLYLQLVYTESEEGEARSNSKVNDLICFHFRQHNFMAACILLDLCSLDDGMLQFTYSCIAASIVYSILTDKVFSVSGYTMDDIKHCLEWLQPFVTILIRKLRTKLPLRDYRFRKSRPEEPNSKIVFNGANTLQNHFIDLRMLEEVYDEIKRQRFHFRNGNILRVTGWTASTGGFFDQSCVDAYVAKRRKTE